MTDNYPETYTKSSYNIIAETEEYTVVAEYTPLYRRQTAYQSESDLENEFIKELQEQGYEYLPIKNEQTRA